ncbi:MAG: hypothetical protein HQL78_05540, partial [Magnetococcales bacterium]|nr:hypothetical protein [Magnetococcales bacterium]
IGHLMLLFLALFTLNLPLRENVVQILKKESSDPRLAPAAWYLTLRWLPALFATLLVTFVAFLIFWHLLPWVFPNLYEVAQMGMALARSPMSWIYPFLLMAALALAALKWGRN